MEKFSVRLFGIFRTLNTSSEIIFEAPVPIQVGVLKELLSQEIRLRGGGMSRDWSTLVSDSALATEQCVLSSKDNIERGCSLALLPPVCGG